MASSVGTKRSPICTPSGRTITWLGSRPRYIITAATDSAGTNGPFVGLRHHERQRSADAVGRVLEEVHLPDRVARRGLDVRRDRAHLLARVHAVGHRADLGLPREDHVAGAVDRVAQRDVGLGRRRRIAVDDVERDDTGAGRLQVVDELRHLVARQRVAEALGVDRLRVEPDDCDRRVVGGGREERVRGPALEPAEDLRVQPDRGYCGHGDRQGEDRQDPADHHSTLQGSRLR